MRTALRDKSAVRGSVVLDIDEVTCFYKSINMSMYMSVNMSIYAYRYVCEQAHTVYRLAYEHPCSNVLGMRHA